MCCRVEDHLLSGFQPCGGGCLSLKTSNEKRLLGVNESMKHVHCTVLTSVGLEVGVRRKLRLEGFTSFPHLAHTRYAGAKNTEESASPDDYSTTLESLRSRQRKWLAPSVAEVSAPTPECTHGRSRSPRRGITTRSWTPVQPKGVEVISPRQRPCVHTQTNRRSVAF